MTNIEIYDPPPLSGKDYVVQFKIRNGPLLRAIRSRGWTIAVTAENAGISVGVIYRFLALRETPLRKNGEWRLSTIKLANALRYPPGSLWPEQHLEHALAKCFGELEVSGDEVHLLISTKTPQTPEDELQKAQLYAALHRQLAALPQRAREILEARFGFNGNVKQLDELGQKYGVTGARVRQIQEKAIRSLGNRCEKFTDAGYGDVDPFAY